MTGVPPADPRRRQRTLRDHQVDPEGQRRAVEALDRMQFHFETIDEATVQLIAQRNRFRHDAANWRFVALISTTLLLLKIAGVL